MGVSFVYFHCKWLLKYFSGLFQGRTSPLSPEYISRYPACCVMVRYDHSLPIIGPMAQWLERCSIGRDHRSTLAGQSFSSYMEINCSRGFMVPFVLRAVLFMQSDLWSFLSVSRNGHELSTLPVKCATPSTARTPWALQFIMDMLRSSCTRVFAADPNKHQIWSY